MARIGTDIQVAQNHLEAGELVAIPTETVYGLAAHALNEDAVARIFEAKGRPRFDPLIVHTHHPNQFDQFAAAVPDTAHRLAEVFCPGPVTFILPKKSIIPDLVTSGHQTVGLRIPNHSLTLELLSALPFPLAAPSANPFGYVSPTTAQHVSDQLGNVVDYILDGGSCQVGLESTILAFQGEEVVVLRLGGLELEAIEDTLGKKVGRIQTSSSNPEAPGMLNSHYNPRKKLLLGEVEHLLMLYPKTRVGVISYQKTFHYPNIVHSEVLSPTGELREAASRLFAALRTLDRPDIDLVLCEPVPDEGLGKAINDRLKRAAAQ